jgi:hypothetical protein
MKHTCRKRERNANIGCVTRMHSACVPVCVCVCVCVILHIKTKK